MSVNLKDTLNLPKTAFPMKADLVNREPIRVQHWEQEKIYSQIRELRKDSEQFLLHDGPPFANGDIHLGHVLNKVLKDIVVRYKTMRGYDSPYITGWDCHGLPIEHAVSKELRKSTRDLKPASLRKDCEAFARKYVDVQLEQFKRLGILTDWDNHYETMEGSYEADILRTFAAFVEKGMVYRSKKPVYWSIPYRTALAEAEVEYNEHTSSSIWVAFKSIDAERYDLPAKTNIVIWTTTPWTLPANLAIALHPRFVYTTVKKDGETYLVAKDRVDAFLQDVGWKADSISIEGEFLGQGLEHLRTSHPFIDRESPVVLADYVTLESGTGAVHTAPGHGLEDYQTGLKYGLDIYCPVNDDGVYENDGMVPESLVGVTVLEKGGKNPANIAVLELLEHKNALLEHKRFVHQYPHCWRSKTPVIFRAMDQFFMRLDEGDARSKVLEEIEKVDWVPGWGKNRIVGAVESRPDWCISRQRHWGVPIPVFFDEDGEALLDKRVIFGIAEKVAQHGTQIWFEWSEKQLLEGISLPEEWSEKDLVKGSDTLDVWFDSGSSHAAVLDQYQGLKSPADLYLEGSDQHRGWFQSSIWTSVVSKGAAPYKTVLTHGFVVDENGRKMSKSQGAKTATQWLQDYGADILRLLISSEDYRGDLPIGNSIIKQVSGIYRLIRNTFRFQLGNLHDFDFDEEAVPFDEMHPLDQWVLWESDRLVESVTAALDDYDFPKAYQTIQLFCNQTLSALYHDILKDRLYTLAPSDKLRRSSQTALHHLLERLIRVLNPILPFTCDEALAYREADQDFSNGAANLLDWPEPFNHPSFESSATKIKELLQFKAQHVNEVLEGARKDKTIGQSLEAQVTVSRPKDSGIYQLLEENISLLPELFIVSVVKLSDGEDNVEVEHAPGVRCPRSWRWVPELVKTENWGSVSPRDKAVHDVIYKDSK